MKLRLIAALLLLTLLAAPVTSSQARAAKHLIGLSLPAASAPPFGQISRSAQAAAAKLGADLIVENGKLDTDSELANVNDLIAKKVEVLVLFPTDPVGSIASVQAANKANIPVLLLGSGLDANAGSFTLAGSVVPDPALEGQVTAATVCKAINNKGTVVELVNNPAPATPAATPDTSATPAATSAATPDASAEAFAASLAQNHSAGFNAAIAKMCKTAKVMPISAADTKDMQNAFSDLLSQGAINAVVGYDTANLLAVVDAANTANAKIKTYGYGFDKDLVQAVQTGILTASIGPDGDSLGQLAVSEALNVLNGKFKADKVTIKVIAFNADLLKAQRGSCGSGQSGCKP